VNTADGFGLLNSLRTQENHEGLLIDTLEQRREKLACAILGDYPTFKSSVKKSSSWTGTKRCKWDGLDNMKFGRFDSSVHSLATVFSISLVTD
jgi:hypothetical protein